MKRLLPEPGNAALIALGVLSAAMGLKGFLLSSNFIDGGVTDICMLLAKTTGLSLSVLLPLIVPIVRRKMQEQLDIMGRCLFRSARSSVHWHHSHRFPTQAVVAVGSKRARFKARRESMAAGRRRAHAEVVCLAQGC